jgi:phosphomannomutase
MERLSKSALLKRDLSKLLFSVAGARGIVGESIDVDVVTRLTLAFGSVLPPGPIVIGRDTRPSGASLGFAAAAAVMATGHDCIDIDIATTPTVEMMVTRLEAVGGIIVTASHNPVEWNALKFLDHRGIFIDADTGRQVYDVYQSGQFELADGRSAGLYRTYEQASTDHLEAILALEVVDVERIRRRRFRAVLDCINGAGSVIAPQLLDTLGVELVEINCQPNGDFFRDPEPRPENLSALADQVRSIGADIGFAVDPDADRLAMVDDRGRAVSEEYTLGIGVDHILAHRSGPVVVNLSTSALTNWIAAGYDAPVHRTPVGEAHVVAEMLSCGAIIGGEGNGGVIYPGLHPGRDAPLAMALILQFLTERDVSLSEQINRYPSFVISKEKVPKSGEFSKEKIARLAERLEPAEVDTRDGVKVLLKEGWFHLRVSNTEGIVRIIAEAADEDQVRRLKRVARQILDESFE